MLSFPQEEAMKIAMAQINTTVGDICGNRDLILRTIDRARLLEADLVVFPELCLTGYPPRDLLGLQGFVEANLEAVREIAAKTRDGGVILGFVDHNAKSEGRRLHNAAALLTGGEIGQVVYKTLLPTYDVFDEDRYFERGSDTRLVEFRGRTLGISICEDAWNSEEFWARPLYPTDPIRDQVQRGADLLINISASPFELSKPSLRYRMILDHVQRHRVPFLYLNLVGGNDDLIFDGNSLALGRAGNLIAQGKSFAEDLFIVDPDSERVCSYREEPEMRNLFQALVIGTRDYAKKCGFHSAVLGLSGGIDSAVTACIAAEAVGQENVLGVSMPSVYSAPESHDDARDLARNLGIRFEVIPIQSLFLEYRLTLAPVFSGIPEDITEENLQARIRGNLLMALSNKFGHLVLSTGNKSELGVGYCTLYGDMAGGLAVISDVPKTDVYRLARFINQEREVIPETTIQRPPTAELRPNQTDQDSLPAYEILDGILRMRIEDQLSVDEIIRQGYEEATVKQIVQLINQNEYKRRQAAPGLKVTSRAFGSGRRMPLAKRVDL
jgi:NAD+ synthase (glutamine-hydrolysing)